MRLVRNTTKDGSCKYALIRLDKMRSDGVDIAQLQQQLGPLSRYLEIAGKGDPEEALVIKLKDINSPAAIGGYSGATYDGGDTELAEDVIGLLQRAGKNSPFCKKPD